MLLASITFGRRQFRFKWKSLSLCGDESYAGREGEVRDVSARPSVAGCRGASNVSPLTLR